MHIVGAKHQKVSCICCTCTP